MVSHHTHNPEMLVLAASNNVPTDSSTVVSTAVDVLEGSTDSLTFLSVSVDVLEASI